MLFNQFPDAWVLTGPTGSGKSAIAVQLAEHLGAEIVSMDSMALYRGVDISTAKPTAEARARVLHHLIDVLEPWESASVAWWLEQAVACCRDIVSRGRTPLFVGGTPLYLKALLYGLFEGPPADHALRQRLLVEAETLGPEVLHARLRFVDPHSASRLHPNDVRRVVRALEVWELTRRPLSEWQGQWPLRGGGAGEPGQPWTHVFCLDLPRPELYARINARVERMVEDGLVEEFARLRSLPRPLSREATQALGYCEAVAHLDGRLSKAEMVAQLQTRTRQFAKRQITWFRQFPIHRVLTRELTFSPSGLTISLWDGPYSTQR